MLSIQMFFSHSRIIPFSPTPRVGVFDQTGRITLSDLMNSFGEEAAKSLLKTFSCPQNSEIQNFISNNAIDFTKRKITMTHLLMTEGNVLAGFFSLTHKPLTVREEDLSPKLKRIFKASAKYNYETNCFEASGFLIAQFSKNFTDWAERLVSGNEMMDEAISVLRPVQHEIGGRIVFLECDKSKPRLSDFYMNDNNRFLKFGECVDEDDGVTYNQLMRIL